ncbi:unnamed protein product [Paramecium sonneborni]|nr:unnamed protein product [Paramecium sonneborni]
MNYRNQLKKVIHIILSLPCMMLEQILMSQSLAIVMFGIKETPTFIFFQNQVPYMYFGNRRAHIVMKWIVDFFQGNPFPPEILSESQLQQFLDNNNQVFFYQRNYTEDNDQIYQKFYQFALQNKDPEILFAYSCIIQINNSKILYFYKQESQEKTYFTKLLTSENLKRFIQKINYLLYLNYIQNLRNQYFKQTVYHLYFQQSI